MNKYLMMTLAAYYAAIAIVPLARALAREIRRIRDPHRNRITHLR